MSVDLSPILAALGAPDTVAAWEIDSFDDPTLSVFDVAGTPKQVAYVAVEPSERKAANQALADAGQAVGYYASGTGVVWRSTEAAYDVWGPDGAGITADASTVRLRGGPTLERGTITAVSGYLENDNVARGVRLHAGDDRHVVAEHLKVTAALDGDFAAWTDITWVSTVAHQLGRWLGVPVSDPG